jgi:hypothetical protein
MKRFTQLSFVLLVAATICTTALSAQETTTVSVTVKKDGKVVTDTTYRFEDAVQAEHALKMIEAMNGVDSKAMVFISEDGKKTVLEGDHGDTLVWIHEGDHVKVIKHATGEGHPCHYQGENVVVIRTEDGETFDILMGEDQEGVKTKKVKVMVIEEGDGEWETVEEELGDIDHDTDDDNNGEKEKKEVEVIVIKQKQ